MNILVSAPNKAVLLPPHPQLDTLYNAKRLHLNGRDWSVMPHRDDLVRAARKFGVQIPAPILYYYDWPKDPPPLEAQKKTAAELVINRRMYVTSQIGTGKTRAALFAADWLIRTGQINKVLILAPLSTLNTVWAREIFIHFPHLKAAVLHGTRQKRFKLYNDEQYNIHIINHDAVHIIAEQAVKDRAYQLCIIDEVSAFRTRNTRRWKALNFLVNGPPREQRALPFVWGMTATPTPNAPTDAWAQCRLITPDTTPRSFVRFRDEVMLQVTQFKWVPKPNAASTVSRLMQPNVRFLREDCFDLPPVTFTDVEVPLSKPQELVYKELLREYHAEMEQHQITAVNEGAKLNKLLQVCGGYVYDNNRQVVNLNAKARLDELERLILSSDAKVLVFVPYVHALTHVYLEMQSRGISCAKVYGDTKKSERDEIFNLFQHSSEYKALIAHPRTMSHGLTLTAADTAIWYMPTTSPETYEQACGRITRGGQTRHQHVIHIIGAPVEAKTYKRLKDKEKLQGLLLDILTNEGG